MDALIETARLIIRRAIPSDEDIDLYYRLWNDPMVMGNVGFPGGLSLSKKEIRKIIEQEDDSVLDNKLIVALRDGGTLIGECKLGSQDDDGVAHTDIKLLPEFWGNSYGVEIKRALLDYLFMNTACKAVKATPNRQNEASIKMQEAVGGQRVEKGVYKFPDAMSSFTKTVKYYLYIVTREAWEKSRQ